MHEKSLGSSVVAARMFSGYPHLRGTCSKVKTLEMSLRLMKYTRTPNQPCRCCSDTVQVTTVPAERAKRYMFTEEIAASTRRQKYVLQTGLNCLRSPDDQPNKSMTLRALISYLAGLSTMACMSGGNRQTQTDKGPTGKSNGRAPGSLLGSWGAPQIANEHCSIQDEYTVVP